MKRILAGFLALLLVCRNDAWAVPSCASQLIPPFTPAQGTSLCKIFGSALTTSLIPQTDNTYDIGSASKQWRTEYLGTNLVFGAASARIIPGATSLLIRNNANSATNLSILDAGTVSVVTGDLAVTAGNLTFGAASAKIIPGATSLLFQNNANNATNLSITDAGVFTLRGNDATVITSADTARLLLYGGSVVSNSNGASLDLNGNTFSGSAGNVFLSTSTSASSALTLNAKGSSGTIVAKTNNATVWTFGSAGTLTQDGTNGGSILMPVVASSIVNGIASIPANVSSASGATPAFLGVKNASSNSDQMALVGIGANTNPVNLDIFKTRATDGQATTIVNNADGLGSINFFGADGTAYRAGARIIATVSAAPGVSDMPTSLDMQLSPDGSATTASVLKLDQDKSATFTGIIKSTATTLGWVVRTGANTACTTTCGASKGCVGGYDITGTTLVDCASAAADSCFCTF